MTSFSNAKKIFLLACTILCQQICLNAKLSILNNYPEIYIFYKTVAYKDFQPTSGKSERMWLILNPVIKISLKTQKPQQIEETTKIEHFIIKDKSFNQTYSKFLRDLRHKMRTFHINLFDDDIFNCTNIHL